MGAPNGFGDPTPLFVALGVFLAVGCGALLLVMLILSLFNLTVQRTLGQVRQANRSLAPGLIWLDLVPVLNLIWGLWWCFRSPDRWNESSAHSANTTRTTATAGEPDCSG